MVLIGGARVVCGTVRVDQPKDDATNDSLQFAIAVVPSLVLQPWPKGRADGPSGGRGRWRGRPGRLPHAHRPVDSGSRLCDGIVRPVASSEKERLSPLWHLCRTCLALRCFRGSRCAGTDLTAACAQEWYCFCPGGGPM